VCFYKFNKRKKQLILLASSCNLNENMVAVPIKQKAMTLHEKLYTIQRVEANQNTCVQMATELSMPVTTLNGIIAKKDDMFMSQ
jgi:hypothetical protein